ncbi:MAG: hypothetical protein U9N46_00440 [Euryarchaeota archaeon]|nr:MAG: hypothetical protein C5S48_01860 [ANME-2 cluster archaeon]MEA1863662.1 hypothetical protein [Euryarchaeota archaeon]
MKMMILSAILYVLYSTLVFILLVRISSFIATVVLLGMPLLTILIAPDRSISFLAYQHAVLGDGMIPINNLHILLFIWSSLLAIILYTEFITWYLGRGAGGAPGDAGGAGDTGDADAESDTAEGGGMDDGVGGSMDGGVGDGMGGDEAFGDLMGGDEMWGGGDDEMPPPF